jgi:hypothetical protein
MEYLSWRSLQAEIEASGRLPWEEVARIGGQVADALAVAHASRIVHRDLKPDNVLLSGDRVVVTDFGIARVLDATGLTASGAVIGTPLYMAPEQLRGEPVGPAADMWSLGATLYAAVEGRPPFDGSALAVIVAAVLSRCPPPAVHAGPLADLLSQLMARDPLRRPSASTVGTALRAASSSADHSAGIEDAGSADDPRAGSVLDTRSTVTDGIAPVVPGDVRSSGPSRVRRRARSLAVGVTILVALGVGTYLVEILGATPSRAPGAGVGTSSPAKTLLVGDACLVGTWFNGGFPSSVEWNNTNVSLKEGPGGQDHIYADGTDRDSWAFAATLYGTYQGKPLEEIEQGTHTWTLRAMPGSHTVSMTDDGWSLGSKVWFKYADKKIPGGFSDGGTYSVEYRCAGNTLTWSYLGGKVYETETRTSYSP